MYQEAVMVPTGDWAKTRLKNLSETDRVRDESRVGSGFGKKIENWISRDKAFPNNVLHMATECGNRSHSAAFPEALPEWFIKLFTQQGDTVLDPFAGSGTTLRVAHRLNRKAIGIEIVPKYIQVMNEQLDTRQLLLLQPKAKYKVARPRKKVAADSSAKIARTKTPAYASD
jgi:site-specific DNA-methyltransferase (adenine-specific)